MLPVRPCGGTLDCENQCALLGDGRIALLGSLSLSVVFEWVDNRDVLSQAKQWTTDLLLQTIVDKATIKILNFDFCEFVNDVDCHGIVCYILKSKN